MGKPAITINKWIAGGIIVLVLLLAFLAGILIKPEPQETLTIGAQAVSNWGGGEQLIYGLDPSGAPIAVGVNASGILTVSASAGQQQVIYGLDPSGTPVAVAVDTGGILTVSTGISVSYGVDPSGTPVAFALDAVGNQIMYGVNISSTPVAPIIDKEGNALVVITWLHERVHVGRSYKVDATDSDLDTNDELSICFQTPSKSVGEIHFFARGFASGASTFQITEVPTVTLDSGAQQVAINRKRESSNISIISTIETTPTVGSVTVNPTITTGLIIREELSGAGQNKIASDSQDIEEFELSENTVYCAIITGNAENLRASLDVSWYEVVP